jgi:D-glycero-beta-D-manno-heptose 1-phosphate adenylyltransferase
MPAEHLEKTRVSMGKEKIVSRGELAALASKLREESCSIVTTNGSFDIVHYGHIHVLKEAKKQGDVLIVGVNSDSSIKSYKGADRPFIAEEMRIGLLAALEMIDFVFLFKESDPRDFLEDIKPHVHVNSEEYGENCIEAETVLNNGGRLHLVARELPLSTTLLVNKIRAS